MILPLLLSALTIDEAVTRALRNNRDLSVARASLVVASAQMAVARALPAPEFGISAGNFDVDPETVRDRSTVALRYSPPRPRELAIRQEIGRAREQGTRAEIRAAEAHVAAEVRLSFRRAGWRTIALLSPPASSSLEKTGGEPCYGRLQQG